MNSILFFIYRILVPKFLRTALLKKSLHRMIVEYLDAIPENEINNDQKEVLDNLKKEEVRIFPYPFHENYSPDKIEVFYDTDKEMRYVLQEGKKLYFKKRWKEKRIKQSYCDLMREQDLNSPHRYLTETFKAERNDVLADIGAAEGNFSLAVIDEIKKVYIFEHDREWIEALKATFAPWPGKVEIVSKYVANHNDGSHIKLDTFLENKESVTFLKIDVDGAEANVLKSGKKLLGSSLPLKMALCTYHKYRDEREFTLLLKCYGFDVTPSKGYMINYYDKKIKEPYLRRGLIRAIRNNPKRK
jgi:hypothetical protein